MQNIQLRPHIKSYAETAMRIKNEVLTFVEQRAAEAPTEAINQFLRGDG